LNVNFRDVSVLKAAPFCVDQAAHTPVDKRNDRATSGKGKPVDVIFNLTVNFKLN
jgi:hypothetical protein